MTPRVRAQLGCPPSGVHPGGVSRGQGGDEGVEVGVQDGKAAVGFKLPEGMDVPAELASRFKFARQESKLAGTIRGSYFDFKNDY